MENSPQLSIERSENHLALPDTSVSAGADPSIGVGKVVLCTLTPGLVTLEYVQSLIGLRETELSRPRSEHKLSNVVFDRCGSLVHMGRNKVTELIHRSYVEEWMLWVDDDIQFPPTLLDDLLEFADPTHRPVISASYKHALEQLVPSAFYYDTSPTPHPVTGGSYKTFLPISEEEFANRLASSPVHPLFKVDGVGTGCLLIHRSILDRLSQSYPPPIQYFHTDISEDGVIMGEDLSFCYRLRQLGIPIFCRGDIKLRHVQRCLYE